MTANLQWVPITGGKHKGKTLRFVKLTEHKVCVERELDGKKIYLNPEHVNMHGVTSSTSTATGTSTSATSSSTTTSNHESAVSTTPADDAPPTWVKIIDGKHKGKTVRYIKHTAERVAVQLEQGKLIYLIPDHVDMNGAQTNIPLTPTTSRQRRVLVDSPLVGNSPPRPVSPDAEAYLNRGPRDDTATENGTTSTDDAPPTWVEITDGKHKGKIVRYIKHTAQRIAVQLEQGKLIYLMPHHVDMNGAQTDFQLRPTTSRQGRGLVNNVLVGNLPPQPVTPDAEAYLNLGPRDDTATENDTEGDFATAAVDDESLYDFVSVAEEDFSYDAQDGTGTAAVSLGDCQDGVSDHNTLSSGDRIYIHSGIHSGKMAIFVKNTAKCVAVKLEGETKIRYLSPDSLKAGTAAQNQQQDENDPMVLAIRHHLPRGVHVQNVTASKVDRTLFGVIFGQDSVFFDMDTAGLAKLPETFAHDSQVFFLAGVKFHEKAKSLTCVYLRASSNDEVTSRLLSIGAFDKLNARKTAARIELLLSTASQPDDIQLLKASDFVLIPEQGNVGCGFIPRGMLELLIGDRQNASEVCALQVRIVIPGMGVFKGMLMEKPGISQIQLPPSMKKVDSAVSPDTSDVAWIMINQSGSFPFKARIQQCNESFQNAKEISKMARWMLAQKGVSQTYLQQPNRQHSSLVGVADPTDGIPPGCVFVSGIQDKLNEFGERILISRFPMTEASDGRILPIVREKPHSMSSGHWEFLCSKPFGLVVFGNPAPGERAMPEQIAQGDLDGDQYFVCWDPRVLQDAVIGDRPQFAAKNPPGAQPLNWWAETLEYMANIEARKQSQQVVGRLHDSWLRKLRFNSQRDALSYGRAFKEALVAVKHGGKVNVPSRLLSEIPRDLHCHLTPV